MGLTKIKKIIKKGRAVSPIIATILLLGITVLAAAIFFVVATNFLATNSKIEFRDASSISIGYSNTLTSDNGTNGWGILQAVLRNNGNGNGKILNVSVLYSLSAYKGVVNGSLLQIPSTASLPLSLGPTAEQTIQIAFPVVETIKVGSTTVDINDHSTTTYILKVTTDHGIITSDTIAATVLGADSPQLRNLPQQYTNVTGQTQFFPTVTVPSGGTVTRVAYTLSNSTFSTTIGTITSPDFSLSWNSRMAGQPQSGNNTVANGVYNLTVKATNNAGISTTSVPISINIANDYYKPYLTSTPIVIDTQSNTATTMTNNIYSFGQQGYAVQVRVNVGDNIAKIICTSSSCNVQNNVTNPTVNSISTVVLYYKLVNTSLYTSTTMQNYQNGTFSALIPASTTVFGTNTSFYVLITDNYGNQFNSNLTLHSILRIHDTIAPSVIINELPLNFTTQVQENFFINATIYDLGSGIKNVTLYYKESTVGTFSSALMQFDYRDSNGYSHYGILVTGNIVYFEGIDYYVQSVDNVGNIGHDGSATAYYHITVIDTLPPVITLITPTPTSPSYLQYKTDYLAEVSVSDNSNNVSRVVMYFEINSISATEYYTNMTYKGGIWEGYIPASNITLLGVNIRFSAWDNSSNQGNYNTYTVSVQDTLSPTITWLNQPPSQFSSANLPASFTFSVNATDLQGISSGSVLLYYNSSGSSTPTTSVTMAAGTGYGNYTYTLNLPTNTHVIYYYVQARDPSGNVGYLSASGSSSGSYYDIQFVGTTLYTVSFTENGLPSGTPWSITFNGNTQSSSINTITYSITSGTYSYTVGHVLGYPSTPTSGSLTVSGNMNQIINFVNNIYSQVNATANNIQLYQVNEAEEFFMGSTAQNINFILLYLSGSGSVTVSIGTTLWGSQRLSPQTVFVNPSQVWYIITFSNVTLNAGTATTGSQYWLNVQSASGTIYWGYTTNPSVAYNYAQDAWYNNPPSSGTLHKDNLYPNIYAIGYTLP